VTLDDIKGRCRIEGECWIWTGALSGKRWPRLHAPDFTNHKGAKHVQSGRRAVWHVKTGKAIPNGWRVFGTCGEDVCMNPAHMKCQPTAQWGIQLAASGKLKGVTKRIVANRLSGQKRSHLDPEKLHLIRSSEKTGLELAAELGLSRSTISKARTGKATAYTPVGGLFSGLMR
jgi:hypothetical protein